jgi:hypothetical protein
MLLIINGYIEHQYANYAEVVYKAPVNSNMIINSGGGRIDYAYEIHDAMKTKNITCWVHYAASAAFQIIMPACKRIVFFPSTQLFFHNTVGGNEEPIKEILNFKMYFTFTKAWGKIRCAPRPDCAIDKMKSSELLESKDFNLMFPENRVLIVQLKVK